MRCRLLHVLLATTAALSLSACAMPSSSGTHVNLTGQILGPAGQPLPGKRVEITLPAEYGLQEIDLEHGKPEEFNHQAQVAVVTTDALGSFSHSFKPVTYSTRFWLIPPLGTMFRTPPEPVFLIRILDASDEYYSVLVKNNDTVYAIHREPGTARLSPITPKTVEMNGKLHPDTRGESEGWTAELRLRRLITTAE